MTIIQIDPPIPLNSPKGSCLAHFLIDYGIENSICWVCFQENGEIWTWQNEDVRAQKNITISRFIKKLEKVEETFDEDYD